MIASLQKECASRREYDLGLANNILVTRCAARPIHQCFERVYFGLTSACWHCIWAVPLVSTTVAYLQYCFYRTNVWTSHYCICRPNSASRQKGLSEWILFLIRPSDVYRFRKYNTEAERLLCQTTNQNVGDLSSFLLLLPPLVHCVNRLWRGRYGD